MEQYRDISIVDLGQADRLVITADSSAGLGEKPADQVPVPSFWTGAMCARVALMEALAVRAQPFLAVQLFGNEMLPTGQKYIQGLRAEYQKAGYPNLQTTGSTEENMETPMSSLGLTLLSRGSDLLIQQLEAGAGVYLIGRPLMGEALLDQFDSLYSYDQVKALAQDDRVQELVPVGSKGARREAEQTARLNGLNFVSTWDGALLDQSAGPATSLLVFASPDLRKDLDASFNEVFEIGFIVA